MKIQDVILKYIKDNGGVSYVEIEEIFEESDFNWKGDLTICSSKNQNVVFWDGWNKEACKIINDLLSEKLIERTPCESFIYLIDGKALKLPIAKRNYNYKKAHWLPIVFNAK